MQSNIYVRVILGALADSAWSCAAFSLDYIVVQVRRLWRQFTQTSSDSHCAGQQWNVLFIVSEIPPWCRTFTVWCLWWRFFSLHMRKWGAKERFLSMCYLLTTWFAKILPNPVFFPHIVFTLGENIYYLLTEIEVITGKSQTEALMYWPSDSEVNTRSIH